MKPITDVHELFRHQRAIRNFTDEDVPDALINQVLTAAIHGPSGSNTQPWHFIVIRDPRVKNAISEVYEEARAAAGTTRPSAGGARLLVHLADRVLHTGVTDHNEVPGLGIGAGGAVDRCSQDLIDECVRDILRGEVADRTLVAKQLMHVGNRLHHKTPYWCGPRPVRRGTHGGHMGQTWAWCRTM